MLQRRACAWCVRQILSTHLELQRPSAIAGVEDGAIAGQLPGVVAPAHPHADLIPKLAPQKVQA